MRSWIMAAMAVCLPGLAGAAQAQTCGPLKRAISLDLQQLGNGARILVPISINGTVKRFMLDTGGARTQIARSTAGQMGLQILSDSRVRLFDMYGNETNGAFVTVDLGIGPLVLAKNDTLITDISGVDGLLAPDVMQNVDIEMDFAGNKLNYFLTDHCEGKVVYWPAGVVATVPFRGWASGDTHMTFPVSIDGHQITALLDTGAPTTTLNADTARAVFDLTPDSPGAVPMGTMAGTASRKIFGWTFKSLVIGGIAVNSPRITVMPDLMGKKGSDNIEADSHIRRSTDNLGPTMLIGMDILRKLHLYVAFKERKLYVTAGSDQTVEAVSAAPK